MYHLCTFDIPMIHSINKGLISPQFLPVICQSLISVIIWVNIPRVAARVGGFLQSSLL